MELNSRSSDSTIVPARAGGDRGGGGGGDGGDDGGDSDGG